MRYSLVFSITALLGATLACAQSTPRELDVPYVPTTDTAVKAMLKLARVKPTDVVYDLGCGDGRIVISAAKNYGAHGVGIDLDPVRIREARENARRAGVDGLVEFREQDLFQSDFHDATVVTLFLLPAINKRLRPQLENLKPGARIVSNTFAIGDWKPARTLRVKNDPHDDYYFGSHGLFLWTLPPRK